MSEISRRSFVAAAVAAALFCGAAAAQNASPINAGPRVALKGYDPVSYFTDGKPEKGSAEFTFAFDDTTYWFKSAEHATKFAADPEHYAPQFDGYLRHATFARPQGRGRSGGLDDHQRQALRLFGQRRRAEIPASSRSPSSKRPPRTWPAAARARK